MNDLRFKAYVPELDKTVDVFALNPMNQTVYLSHQQLFGIPGDDVLMSFREGPDEQERRVKIRRYTGLKDKNGVEIYEGDIVMYEATKNRFGRHQIVFEPKAAAFLLQAITRASIDPIGMKYLGDIARSNTQYDTRTYELCEVIGNIYENPELLKAGDA